MRTAVKIVFLTLFVSCPLAAAHGAGLTAGAAAVEITDRSAGPVNDPLFAKALVVKSDVSTVVLITIDAVAIGEIGRLGDDFLANVRAHLGRELGIAPESVVINASHCHGVVRPDTEQLAVQAVEQAWSAMEPVTVGSGVGHEDRISENRRLKIRDGSEVDMRRAYALPSDGEVAGVGPIDPEIGLLRLDRKDGKPKAVLYNFACHPIMGVPSGGNTADLAGVASRVIEEGLGDGAIALFVQGCAGDINPAHYKDVTRPHDAEPLGNLLGLSVLRAARRIETRDDPSVKIVNETIQLPRGTDLEQRIAAIQSKQTKLVQSLKGTDINFKTFLPLLIQHKLWPEFPSDYAAGYLRDESLGRNDLVKQDAVNLANVEAYLKNIQIMEQLTRLNTNLALLKKHLASNQAAGTTTLDVEVVGLRIGDFRMVTFPGELTVEIGLNIKRAAAHPHTFVAAYTNGYIYYTPTAEQRGNTGYAQEDCDCLVSPEWQAIFEQQAVAILKAL